MAITKISDTPKDILVLKDEDGTNVIRIDHTGKLITPEGWNPDENAFAFWEAVSGYVTADQREQTKRFGMLIRAFSLLKILRDKNCIDTKALNQDDKVRNIYKELMDEIANFFEG